MINEPKLFIGLFFVFIFLVRWYLEYYFAYKKRILRLFREHLTCYYLDWLFVPFNLIFPYTTMVPKNSIITIIIASILADIFINVFWLNLHKKEKIDFYLYDIKINKVTIPGFIHFIFFIFQFSLVLSFILFSKFSALSLLGIFLLIMFFVGTQFTSKKIHGAVSYSNRIFFILGTIVIILKIFSWFFGFGF